MKTLAFALAAVVIALGPGRELHDYLTPEVAKTVPPAVRFHNDGSPPGSVIIPGRRCGAH